MTNFARDVEGAIVAMPVMRVDAKTSVSIRPRRLRVKHYAVGTWLQVRVSGRLTFCAVRSDRGWESVA